jgi:endonuclease-3
MNFQIRKVITTLKNYYGSHRFDRKNRRDPFRTLVSCILSLRTKDEVTDRASKALFKIIGDPYGLERIDEARLARTIYPVGFYKTKAKRLREIAFRLISDYEGEVPDSIDELLKLKGVGRKTANLVVSLGFGKPGICVDTHVHRITNRLGYVRTRNPYDTEMSLRKKLPPELWQDINWVLVSHGQKICRPVSPLCSICPIERYCRKRGVKHAR